LLVDFAYELGAKVIVKGVRNPTDFEYENSLFRMSDSQQLGIETVIFIAQPELAHVSSSAVKQIQKEQGLIHDYVPLNVKQALEAKISQQFLLAISGEIGAGKSYLAQRFVTWGKELGIKVHNIELDHLAHEIYQELDHPGYQQVRAQLKLEFGSQIERDDGAIDRQQLGKIVFANQDKLQRLNQIMRQPLLVRLRRALYEKQGLILLNAALIAETNMSHLANHHVCLVKTDPKSQRQRLKARDLSDQQIERRLASQYTYQQKKKLLQRKIEAAGYGHLWQFHNGQDVNLAEWRQQFKQIKNYFFEQTS
jgi:dephospho-CoA kinase